MVRWWKIYHNPVLCKILNHKLESLSKNLDAQCCVRCGIVKNGTKTNPTVNQPENKKCYFCSACSNSHSLKEFEIEGYDGLVTKQSICFDCFYVTAESMKPDVQLWEQTDYFWNPKGMLVS